jgi:hypothetical protein
MPPLAIVKPVKLPRVPAIVELPVIDAPPLAIVKPVKPVSVPVMELLPVIAAPLAVTEIPAENVWSAENVWAVPLCAA